MFPSGGDSSSDVSGAAGNPTSPWMTHPPPAASPPAASPPAISPPTASPIAASPPAASPPAASQPNNCQEMKLCGGYEGGCCGIATIVLSCWQRWVRSAQKTRFFFCTKKQQELPEARVV